MGRIQAPFMYSSVQPNDARFPETKFDPKAVTRASWEPKKIKPKPEGPLVSFNRHPDSHLVLSYRSTEYASMSPRAKNWIKWLRRAQLSFRLLQLTAALGILALMILITKVDALEGWIMRITPGVVTIHCIYSIYHLSRNASDRSPASSAAYQLFSGVTDLGIASFYAFGTLSVHNKGSGWETLLSDQGLMDAFRPAVYYTLIGASGLHVVSLCIACWLGWMFRKISLMPPDMNPLEDHLTARPKHKRNKSSVTTFCTVDNDKRMSTPRSARRQSIVPHDGIHDNIEPPRTVPFSHTRTGSSTTIGSRVSRPDFSQESYQRVHNTPNRDSITSMATKAPTMRRDSYADVRPDEQTSRQTQTTQHTPNESRAARFTETWLPTDSLISRTNQRNREIAAAKASAANRQSKSYEALSQRYDADHLSDDEYGDENDPSRQLDGTSDELRPHPLRLNPPAAQRETPPRAQTPYFFSLAEVSPNARRVTSSQDIADEKPAFAAQNRQSSIQPESAFYSRPYGDLQPATSPVMVGSDRKVSSGNDFDPRASGAYARRNVSGKLAEEGRSPAGARYSFYDGRYPLAEQQR